jgi:predicted nuclease with RNAse H fold
VTVEQSKRGIKMTEITVIEKKRGGNVLHPTNPFMVDMTTRTRRITNKRGDMMLVSAESGEISAPIAGFWEAEEVDATKFVKLFVKGVKALKELSGSGTKVFEVLYLAVQSSIGKDQIYLSFQLVDQVLTPMSSATYARGLRELIEKGFLAATPQIGIFWLNPSFVFNGDRLAFVKEYRKTGTKARVLDDKTKDLFAALPSTSPL